MKSATIAIRTAKVMVASLMAAGVAAIGRQLGTCTG
jgi:hypothetical protein